MTDTPVEPVKPEQLPEFVLLFNFIVSANTEKQDLVQCLHAWEALKRLNAMVVNKPQAASVTESKKGGI